VVDGDEMFTPNDTDMMIIMMVGRGWVSSNEM
jgi:hypothetical protein